MIEFEQPEAERKRSIAKLLDNIIAKYEDKQIAQAGLTRQQIEKMTHDMKRDNWEPPIKSAIAIKFFLLDGFKDCTVADFKKWGVSQNAAQAWAKNEPDIVITAEKAVHQGNSTAQQFMAVYNLRKNADQKNETVTHAQAKRKQATKSKRLQKTKK
jgi:hypothetical protein